MLINMKQYPILLFLTLSSQEIASKLKNEISQQLLRLNVSNYSMALVKVCIFYLLFMKQNFSFETLHSPLLIREAMHLRSLMCQLASNMF